MQKQVALFLLFLLLISPVMGQGIKDIESLYQQHRWFELRDALSYQKADGFYQTIVACSFNEIDKCQRGATAIFRSAPGSEQAFQAHEALGYLYFREGRYRQALSEIEAQLAIKPDKADLKSGRELLRALSQNPELRTERRRMSRLKYDSKDGGMYAPVTINGKTGQYFIDTGLNVSLLSESEAKRLGLSIREISPEATRLTGNAGGQIGFRLALADRLTLGDCEIRNVVFLVVSDEQEPFRELPPGRRGGIGLPVLMALESVSWSSDGSFEVGASSKRRRSRKSNLCFEGAMPVVEGSVGTGKLRLVLDTGAEETELYPRFAKDFPNVLPSAGMKATARVTGVDGSVDVEATTVSNLKIGLGGYDVLLRSVQVLMKPTTPASLQFHHGNLGLDVLSQARRVTIDFRLMKLMLE